MARLMEQRTKFSRIQLLVTWQLTFIMKNQQLVAIPSIVLE